MERCRSAGEAGHREIEASPKEMDRAHSRGSTVRNSLNDAVALQQHAPETVGRNPRRMRHGTRSSLKRIGSASSLGVSSMSNVDSGLRQEQP